MARELKMNEVTGLLHDPSADLSQGANGALGSDADDIPGVFGTARSTSDRRSSIVNKKKKKKHIKMTTAGSMLMERQVQMMLAKHNLAAKFFECRQFWLFTIPQALLAMIASILAFAATTDLFEEQMRILLNTIAGSTSGIAIFVQTMSGICNYKTRGAMHEAVAVDLRNLRDDLVLLRFQLKLEKQQPTRSTVGEDVEDSTDLDMDFGQIRSRFIQTLSGCKSNVPMKLTEAFHGVKSDLMVSESRSTSEYFSEVYEDSLEICYQRMGFKAYDILAAEILESLFFPMFLPDPGKTVDRTMGRLRKEMLMYNSFWVDGGTEVQYCYQLPCFP